MKYTLETECAPCGLAEFAEKNGLDLVVHERVLDPPLLARNVERYYADFNDVEVQDRGCLISEYGNGNIPNEAITDYARRLLGKRLVYKAFTPERREFVAPNAWVE